MELWAFPMQQTGNGATGALVSQWWRRHDDTAPVHSDTRKEKVTR